uniref:Uncharacterized protein n=1 Tax=Chromera velia CCMP2878 TaxID=1169474 RepID=A0A0G4HZQ1_9ALVE|eukprot:Cvel_34090.t1-p1 / transcript=Cvel_34090.t1 / gene=Cvel_34090 / organism=Chromera_velia_CCMP2878 / gene_product=hypothetical protein / transcript_product=hypothetical protein / location=Cvel_scaffold5740:2794-3027(+) / protein_length=78 / sequence_SO=supercontig / SO=protein_coding / is_pseudo=false
MLKELMVTPFYHRLLCEVKRAQLGAKGIQTLQSVGCPSFVPHLKQHLPNVPPVFISPSKGAAALAPVMFAPTGNLQIT